MTLRRYDAIFFDLFDTLVHFDRERLPQIDLDGRTIRSTAGCLHALLQPHAPSVSLAQCYDALAASWKEAERLRAIDHREVGAPERFRDFFSRLALEHATLSPDLATVLIEAHKAELSKAASFPPHYGPLLRRLAARYRLAVVSNFDGRLPRVLASLGLRPLVDLVVHSTAAAAAKPDPAIFRAALSALGVAPSAALHAGDGPVADVEGARRAGLRAVLVDRGDHRPRLPADVPRIAALSELSALTVALP